MTRGLSLQSARWTLYGTLIVCSWTASSAHAQAPRPTSDPALLPVPASDPNAGDATAPQRTAAPRLSSATAEKLVLVSAEIDAEADAPQVTMIEKGTSSRKHRKTATDDLPMQRLTPPQKQLVDVVLQDLSVFRRLPAFQCELDIRVHDFFTAHPDVAVSIWRAMAISQLQMTQTSPGQYTIDTRDGTTGVVTVLHQSRESCLVYCEGMFKSPYLTNPIQARSLMHLRTSLATDKSGRRYTTHQADLFVSFPSQKVDTVARLISPVSNSIIDRNFQEISLFIHVMWQAMAKQPGWVEHIANSLDGVPQQRKDELLKLTADVYVTEQTNRRQRAGLPVSLEVIRPPQDGVKQAAGVESLDPVR